MNTAHWLGNMAAWSAQAAVLIAVGAAAAWAFRLRAPRIRLAYGQVLLAICLLLPAVEPWHAPGDSHVDITTTAGRPVPPDRATPRPVPWRQALLIALVVGCAARTLWLVAGFVRLRAWRSGAEPFSPLPLHIERMRNALAPQAELGLSSSVSGPVTFGLRRPLVVLPNRFLNLGADTQEAIICHELLHVRRRDWIVTVAEEWVRAALWFHPAIWWLISRIQLAREQTVDAAVVEFTRNRTLYLNALLAMAGTQPPMDLSPATLFLRKRHLKNRMALLLKEGTMSKRRLLSTLAASGAALCGAGWLALHTFPLEAMPAGQDADSVKLLHSVAPSYPQEARDKHIEGPVVLQIQIDAEGHVSDAKVLSGPEELRRAALEAVLQWHYSPEAMSLPATTQVTVNFKLPKRGAPEAAPAEDLLPEGKPVTINSITVTGLTPATRDELLQRLPVHEGDTVDAERVRSLAASVRAFDDHLRLMVANGNLRIFLPQADASSAPNRIRIGSNVQRTKLLTRVMPVYPPEAKAAHIQGMVLLEAIIGKDGTVENLKVLSGHPLLIPASLDAVRQWKYQTTLLNGDPVEVVTQIEVNFTLSE